MSTSANIPSPTKRPAPRTGPTAEPRHELPPIVKRPRPLSWVTAFVVAVLLAMLINNIVTNDNWHWNVVWSYLFNDAILAGLGRTMYLTIMASILGLILGMIGATMRMSSNKIARSIAYLYIWIIRAIPALVLLLIIYFIAALLPTTGLGIPFGPEFITFKVNSLISASSAAILGLGIYLGGYSAEIFRGAILSVPEGQYEASRALGMPPLLMMRRQIMPQAVRVMIPSLANELITMFKNTALVTVIGYTELLTTAQLIYSRNFETIPLLTVACLWYLVITSVAMYGQQKLEAHYGRGFTKRVESKSDRKRRKLLQKGNHHDS